MHPLDWFDWQLVFSVALPIVYRCILFVIDRLFVVCIFFIGHLCSRLCFDCQLLVRLRFSLVACVREWSVIGCLFSSLYSFFRGCGLSDRLCSSLLFCCCFVCTIRWMGWRRREDSSFPSGWTKHRSRSGR